MSSIVEFTSARISLVSVAVLAGIAGALVARPAPAAAAISGQHDGRWSIEVITQKGDCDRAYRYAVIVEKGEARYAGSEPIAVTGKVAPDGSVKGSIAYGDNRANVLGKLSNAFGDGQWTWSGSRTCSGVWNAERRG
jgi:hypothetical protein